MAKPDTDDGWLKYAHELDAALAVGDFNKGLRIVLHELFGQCFGPAKLRSARLSPSEIARRSGMSREQVSRASRELMDSHVIEKLPDGSFRFIKNYESWTRDGHPRLAPQEVWYCRDAPARARAFWVGKSGAGRAASGAKARDEIVTDNCQNRDKTVTITTTVSGEPPTTVCDKTVTESVTVLSRNSGSHPISGEFKNEDEDEEAHGRNADSGNVTNGKPSRPVTPDPAEVDRVIAWVKSLGVPFEELESKVRMMATSYPLDWIEAAILCGLSADAHGKVWSYAHKCLVAWWKNGRPDDAKIEEAKASPAVARLGSHPHRPADTMSPSQRRQEALIAGIKRRGERIAAENAAKSNGELDHE